MSMNDPIADLLTRIRNASAISKKWVDVKCSNVNIRILFILKEEYFIRDYVKIEDKKQGILRVYLKYSYDDKPVIRGLKRISTPGCREYVSVEKLPRVLNGMGISIISTSKGVMSNKKAKNLNIGGEILCHVW
ncbi:MAG: 30S ribosomal protein S8 [Candidatus Marinimicrobia bacterium]|nr:30S ribosomal protein S8 [Candidatus Neomarinimicrobiota bacterium]